MKKIVLFLVFFISACTQNLDYDFILDSEQGAVSLKDFRGKKLVIYFGFTTCPDLCPMTLALIAKELKKFKNDLFLLFISLDTEQDKDIKAVNEYVRYFYENSSALLAKDEKSLAKLTQKYGVLYEKIELEEGYTLAHSNELFLIDAKGKFFARINDFSKKNLAQKFKAFVTNEQKGQ